MFNHHIIVASQNLETYKLRHSLLYFFPAMKVAMGMQKQITAKRGQIDALQSKIQFLEEAMTNSNKVSPYPQAGGRQCVHLLIYYKAE